MSRPVVELERVTLTYGSGDTAFTALAGIDLAIESGALALLLGPSGSGKTTLLQVMGCLLRASTGRVRVHGNDVSGETLEALTRYRLRHFGFVFQHYNLFPTLRAWENVAIALDLKGANPRGFRAEAVRLLERLGLGARIDSFPAQLSGGQKQRVAIARAIAGRPDVILADEPTAALDGRTGIGVAQVLRELAHEVGCAVVVVSHDPRMLPYADRVLELEDGLITADRVPSAPEIDRAAAAAPLEHPRPRS
jgi:putative ABC transport system ATP-binding protein